MAATVEAATGAAVTVAAATTVAAALTGAAAVAAVAPVFRLVDPSVQLRMERNAF